MLAIAHVQTDDQTNFLVEIVIEMGVQFRFAHSAVMLKLHFVEGGRIQNSKIISVMQDSTIDSPEGINVSIEKTFMSRH